MPEVTPKLAKQHPVPQHIAAFEFKLVGDLTLRQFLYAGVGVAIAYAAYISNLDFLIKWSAIFLAGGLGLGLAFFPIQDRGLDTWIVNFVLSITSPTQRIWHKQVLPPEYFREDYTNFLTAQVLSITPPEKRRKLARYLETAGKDTSQLELYEQEFVDRLNFSFPTTGSLLPPEPPPELGPEPQPAPSFVEKLTEQKDLEELGGRNRELGQKIELAQAELRKLEDLKEELYTKNEAFRLRLLEQESLLKRLTKERGQTQLSVQALGDEKERDEGAPPVFIGDDGSPNTIRGFIKDSQGKLLEGVVVIVKDQDGDPVRALKTGGTGQFFSTTPLEDGDYTVEGSFKGKKFDIIKVSLSGQVINPIELKERYRA